MSVSATTRPQRPGEVEGRDYFFKTPEQFDAMVAGDAFLEWAHVFGHRYGTPAAPVDAMLARGHDVLFDIDWQSTHQLRQKKVLADLVSLFIIPPSFERTEQRRVRKECVRTLSMRWWPIH